MNLKNDKLDIKDAINFANQNELLLKRRQNGFLLSDYQLTVLKNNGLDYLKYSNIHDFLFDIEEVLNDDYDDELDLISKQIAEMIYYSEKK